MRGVDIAAHENALPGHSKDADSTRLRLPTRVRGMAEIIRQLVREEKETLSSGANGVDQ